MSDKTDLRLEPTQSAQRTYDKYLAFKEAVLAALAKDGLLNGFRG
jgi:hypothetical protein